MKILLNKKIQIILIFIFLFYFKAIASTPLNIRVSNVRDTQFSVSWVTFNQEIGQIRYGISKSNYENWLTEFDDRDMNFVGDTHHITLSKLAHNKTYLYEIISGDGQYNNSGEFYNITTGPVIPPNLGDFCQPAGKVFINSNLTNPAYNAIAYITIIGKSEDSATESMIITPDGYWFRDLGNFRTNNNNLLFPYICGESSIRVELEGGQMGFAIMETLAVHFTSLNDIRASITLNPYQTKSYELENIINILQILAGFNKAPNTDGFDKKIGINDAIFMLKKNYDLK